MKIQSQTLGQMDIHPRQLFHFPYGLYAFESLRSFALLDSQCPPFYWLQSLETPELAFLALTPQLWLPNYNLELACLDDLLSIGLSEPKKPKAEAQKLEAPDLPLFAIITINEHDSADSTANLQSPIILNRARNLGRQIILQDESWSVRHNLRTLCRASGSPQKKTENAEESLKCEVPSDVPNYVSCSQAG